MKGWRTIVANLVMTALPLVEASGIVNFLPDGWMVWYVLGVLVANIYLRTITTSPVGKPL